MKLTTEIEWHNLLENPDDLPEDGEECMLAVFDKLEKNVGFYYYDSCIFRQKYNDFYIGDRWDEVPRFSTSEPPWNMRWKVIAWSKHPCFDGVRAALLKKCLEKEGTKND